MTGRRRVPARPAAGRLAEALAAGNLVTGKSGHAPSAMAGGANRPNQVPLGMHGRTSALRSPQRRGGGWFSCARKPASVSALRAKNDQCGDLGP